MEVVRNIAEGAKFISLITDRFVLASGMALRASPTSKRDKERLKQIQLRREEQDRIIRNMKGTK